MYKIIASDLDGTLLNENSEITSRTLSAIREIVSRGLEFIICTGRNQFEVTKLLGDYNLDIDAICL